MRRIYKHRISESFILSLIDRGKMSFATYTNKGKGNILNLLLDGKDVGLFVRVRSSSSAGISTKAVDFIQTAYFLEIGNKFTFKNKKTAHIFSGWCGIENMPICHKAGQTETIYFNPYDEIVKIQY